MSFYYDEDGIERPTQGPLVALTYEDGEPRLMEDIAADYVKRLDIKGLCKYVCTCRTTVLGISPKQAQLVLAGLAAGELLDRGPAADGTPGLVRGTTYRPTLRLVHLNTVPTKE